MNNIGPNTLEHRKRRRKARNLLAFCLGVSFTVVTIGLLETDRFPDLSSAEAYGVGVAGGYLGASILLGVAALFPYVGHNLIASEDVEEIRQARRVIGASAIACLAVAIGLGLCAVCRWYSNGQELELAIAIASGLCHLIAVASFLASYRMMDEFAEELVRKAGMLSFGLVAAIVGGWAYLAVIGFAAPMSPIAILASILLAPLLSAKIVIDTMGLDIGL